MGVIIGGCLGHALCTGLAVMGGRFIAQKISVRTGESLILYVICDVKVNNSKCQIHLCLFIIGTTTFMTSKQMELTSNKNQMCCSMIKGTLCCALTSQDIAP